MQSPVVHRYGGVVNTAFVIVALLLCLALAAVLLVGAGRLLDSAWGRLLLLAGVAVLPLAVSTGGLAVGLVNSSQTSFCLSCHEMKPYGQSLFVESRASLVAVHYQDRLLDRDYACYVCHKDYAMFGDVSTKLNGLRHVWTHYLGEAPERIELFAPYPNANCLHCHDDSRRYLDVPVHLAMTTALQSDERSCLSCHRLAHDHDAVAAGEFWQAVRP
jgi:cytochrome c-type protein NapC